MRAEDLDLLLRGGGDDIAILAGGCVGTRRFGLMSFARRELWLKNSSLRYWNTFILASGLLNLIFFIML